MGHVLSPLAWGRASLCGPIAARLGEGGRRRSGVLLRFSSCLLFVVEVGDISGTAIEGVQVILKSLRLVFPRLRAGLV